jgi:hypothetical protein
MGEDEEWEVGEEIEVGLHRRSLDDFFIAGPFPARAVKEIGNMRGRELLLWEMIHHRIAYTRRPRVTLPAWFLDIWEISQDTKADALKRLEAGGWIEVKRPPGGFLKVSLTAKSVVGGEIKAAKKRGKSVRSGS